LKFAFVAGAFATLSFLVHEASAAEQDKPKRPPKPNAVSFEPLAILSRGFLLQYERLFGDRWSALLGPGVRFGAREDFESRTLVLHGEARYWLVRRELISKDVGMVGPFAGAGLNFARTTVESRLLDRSLGSLLTFEETARAGYRFVAFGFQEITPSFGVGLSHEFDERGRLAPSTGIVVGLNLTVGWLF
jgi:hypothetical protein